MVLYVLLWILLLGFLPFVVGSVVAFSINIWLGLAMFAYLVIVFGILCKLKGKAVAWTYFLTMIPYYIMEAVWLIKLPEAL